MPTQKLMTPQNDAQISNLEKLEFLVAPKWSDFVYSFWGRFFGPRPKVLLLREKSPAPRLLEGVDQGLASGKKRDQGYFPDGRGPMEFHAKKRASFLGGGL